MVLLNYLLAITLVTGCYTFVLNEKQLDENSEVGLTVYTNNLVESIQAEGYNSIEELTEYSNQIIKKLKNQLNSYELKTNSKIAYLVDEAVQVLKTENQPIPGGNATKCIEIYAPELREALERGKNDTKLCLHIALTEIENIGTELKNYTDAIRNEIKNLTEIYTECIKPHKPISSATCILKNSIKIQQSIRSILKNGRIAATAAGLKLIKVIELTKQCIDSTVKATEERIIDIGKKILTCILSEESTTTPATTTSTEKLTTSTEAPTTTTTNTEEPITTEEGTHTKDTPETEFDPEVTLSSN